MDFMKRTGTENDKLNIIKLKNLNKPSRLLQSKDCNRQNQCDGKL